MLTASGVVRSDIRSSFAGLSGTAAGVPLNIVLTIVSASTCAPLAGCAVYIWHCDREGRYSLYTQRRDQPELPARRAGGRCERPGHASRRSTRAATPGRWPHIHFEVFPSLAAATSVANKVATSQIALPKAANDLVYATAGYEASVRNAAQVTLARDNVFSDGSALELATMSGSVAEGFTATLTVAV